MCSVIVCLFLMYCLFSRKRTELSIKLLQLRPQLSIKLLQLRLQLSKLQLVEGIARGHSQPSIRTALRLQQLLQALAISPAT